MKSYSIVPALKTLILISFCLFLVTLSSFGAMSDERANSIADAIYLLEGGNNTSYPYGIKSIKTDDPRKVCINTIKNNYVRWQKAGAQGDYYSFLAKRYCPNGWSEWRNKLLYYLNKH